VLLRKLWALLWVSWWFRYSGRKTCLEMFSRHLLRFVQFHIHAQKFFVTRAENEIPCQWEYTRRQVEFD
jgi:hypothetical protein